MICRCATSCLRICLLFVVATVVSIPLWADSPDSAPQAAIADVIVVLGAPGTDDYAAEFLQAAERWQQVAVAADASWQLIGNPAADDPLSDRQRLQQAIGQLDNDSSAAVWIVFIGHGTAGPAGARFNLRGPDLSAADLAQWVAPLRRPLVLIAGFSSSSPFLPALSGDRRVVITATRSGTQHSYSRFAGQLAVAIADPDSDIDHDGEVSVLEAFLAASAAVRDFYRTAARLQTEHALLDDNGDGLGTAADAFRGTQATVSAKDSTLRVDGELAAQLTLAPSDQRLPFTEAELAKRQQLETELRDLHRSRAVTDPSQWQSEARQRLLALARLYQAAEQRQAQQQAEPASEPSDQPVEDAPPILEPES